MKDKLKIPLGILLIAIGLFIWSGLLNFMIIPLGEILGVGGNIIIMILVTIMLMLGGLILFAGVLKQVS